MRMWQCWGRDGRDTGASLYLRQCAEIYVKAFNAPPWSEQWTTEDALHLMKKYYHERDTDFLINSSLWLELIAEKFVRGFAVGMPLANYSDRVDLIARGIDPSAYWVSDLATDPAARKRGCCTELLRKLIKKARKRGFHTIISRTRPDNVQVLGIFARLGFIQDFTYTTVTGGVSSERVVLILHPGVNPKLHVAPWSKRDTTQTGTM